MIRTMTLIAAASLAALAAPALAGTSSDGARTTINVADLDLATTADRARLDTRLRSTINSLCRPGGRALADQVRAQNCRDTALASVAPQVDRAIALAQRNQRLAALDMPAIH
jgi:UrcA family protein